MQSLNQSKIQNIQQNSKHALLTQQDLSTKARANEEQKVEEFQNHNPSAVLKKIMQFRQRYGNNSDTKKIDTKMQQHTDIDFTQTQSEEDSPGDTFKMVSATPHNPKSKQVNDKQLSQTPSQLLQTAHTDIGSKMQQAQNNDKSWTQFSSKFEAKDTSNQASPFDPFQQSPNDSSFQKLQQVFPNDNIMSSQRNFELEQSKATLHNSKQSQQQQSKYQQKSTKKLHNKDADLIDYQFSQVRISDFMKESKSIDYDCQLPATSSQIKSEKDINQSKGFGQNRDTKIPESKESQHKNQSKKRKFEELQNSQQLDQVQDSKQSINIKSNDINDDILKHEHSVSNVFENLTEQINTSTAQNVQYLPNIHEKISKNKRRQINSTSLYLAQPQTKQVDRVHYFLPDLIPPSSFHLNQNLLNQQIQIHQQHQAQQQNPNNRLVQHNHQQQFSQGSNYDETPTVSNFQIVSKSYIDRLDYSEYDQDASQSMIRYFDTKQYSQLSQSDISAMSRSYSGGYGRITKNVPSLNQTQLQLIRQLTIKNYGYIVGGLVLEYLDIQKQILAEKSLKPSSATSLSQFFKRLVFIESQNEGKFIINEGILGFCKKMQTFIESFKFQNSEIYTNFCQQPKYYKGQLATTDPKWQNFIFKLFNDLSIFLLKHTLMSSEYLKFLIRKFHKLFVNKPKYCALVLNRLDIIDFKDNEHVKELQMLRRTLDGRNDTIYGYLHDRNSVLATYKFIDLVLSKLVDNMQLKFLTISQEEMKIYLESQTQAKNKKLPSTFPIQPQIFHVKIHKIQGNQDILLQQNESDFSIGYLTSYSYLKAAPGNFILQPINKNKSAFKQSQMSSINFDKVQNSSDLQFSDLSIQELLEYLKQHFIEVNQKLSHGQNLFHQDYQNQDCDSQDELQSKTFKTKATTKFQKVWLSLGEKVEPVLFSIAHQFFQFYIDNKFKKQHRYTFVMNLLYNQAVSNPSQLGLGNFRAKLKANEIRVKILDALHQELAMHERKPQVAGTKVKIILSEDLSYRILIKVLSVLRTDVSLMSVFMRRLFIMIHQQSHCIISKKEIDQLNLKIWKKHAFDMLFESKKVEVKSINKSNGDQGASSSTLDVSGKECRRAIVEFMFGSLCLVKEIEKVAL
eukprot:403348194